MKRWAVAIVLGFAPSAIAAACSSPVAPARKPACQLFQFRACKDPCGRGVQRCLPSGSWGPCSCVVEDASYAKDAAGKQETESEDAARDVDAAADAAARDAARDAAADAAARDAARDVDAATDRGLLD